MMESSFKKEYEKQTLQDGSVELKFTAKRIGPSAAGFMIIISAVLFFCAWGATAAIFMIKTNDPQGIMSGIIAFAFIWIFMTLVHDKKSKVVIKPNEGLIFDEKQLPFSDISQIGDVEVSGRGKYTAYVYANAHGNEIKITSYMPPAKARAIKQEILTASGMNWGK